MDPNLVQLGIPTSTLLAMAAMFLGLAVIVQVVQEIYKFLTTSKASVYRMVLKDFLGSWVDQLYEPGPAARFHVRGPFQWFKSRPTGQLLPLAKEELLQAMDELPSGWMGETLKTLKEEARLETPSRSRPSPRLEKLIDELKKEVTESSRADGAPGPETHDARRVLELLRPERDGEEAENRTALPASVLLERFYQEFFPQRIRADEEFETLKKNFEHANERRNLRYSFLFAIFVAVFLNFPFDAIYHRAQALSLEEAIALADDVREIRASMEEGAGDEEAEGGELEEGQVEEVEGEEGQVEEGQDEQGQGEQGEDEEREAEERASREELDERLRVVEALAVRLDPEGACGSVPVWKRGWRRMGEILAGTAERPADCVGTQRTKGPNDEGDGDPPDDDAAPDDPGEPAGEGEGGHQGETVRVSVPGPTGWPGLMTYLLNCLITALLVSFGAPFWDRVTDSLLTRARREKNL